MPLPDPSMFASTPTRRMPTCAIAGIGRLIGAAISLNGTTIRPFAESASKSARPESTFALLDEDAAALHGLRVSTIGCAEAKPRTGEDRMDHPVAPGALRPAIGDPA